MFEVAGTIGNEGFILIHLDLGGIMASSSSFRWEEYKKIFMNLVSFSMLVFVLVTNYVFS
jgi:hypothetical protein